MSSQPANKAYGKPRPKQRGSHTAAQLLNVSSPTKLRKDSPESTDGRPEPKTNSRRKNSSRNLVDRGGTRQAATEAEVLRSSQIKRADDMINLDPIVSSQKKLKRRLLDEQADKIELMPGKQNSQ